MEKEIIYYQDAYGRDHFFEWLTSLRDSSARARIMVRLNRLKAGNLGDHKSVGGGVFELRMSFGPGYRIYYGEDGSTIVVLLCGGDKSSQSKDIQRAKAYWTDYLENKDD